MNSSFEADAAATGLWPFDALRPPCPTCGGTQHNPTCWSLARADMDCDCVGCLNPDCVDGKVSIEQLAATKRAVWDDEPKVLHPRGSEPHHWVSAMGVSRSARRLVTEAQRRRHDRQVRQQRRAVANAAGGCLTTIGATLAAGLALVAVVWKAGRR